MMKRYFVILGALALLPFLMASNNGVAEDQERDRTGAPGSSNGCNSFGCHVAGAFSPTTSIELLDMVSMEAVNAYSPNESYIMRVRISPGTGSPSTYGFQATAVFQSDASNAGSFSNPGVDVQLESVEGRHIVEHSMDSPNNFFDVEWRAPSPGSGQVDFYASGVASNNSNSDGGDGFDGVVFSINEAVNSVALLKEKRPYTLNQALGTIITEQNALLEAYNINGQLIKSINLLAGEQTDLGLSGMNILRISTNNDVFGEKLYLP